MKLGKSTFVILMFLTTPVLAAENCVSLLVKLAALDYSKGVEVKNSKVNKTYKSVYAKCDANDKFNGKALPSFNGKPLRCSTDPNRLAFMKKFSDGTIVFKSKLSVDADGSPVSQSAAASAADQPHTSLTYDTTPTEYVNAEDVSFIVIPLTSSKYKTSVKIDTGAKLGDLAAVFYNGHCSFGVIADEGPAYRIGEASLKTHEELGNPQCKTPGQHPCLKIKAGGDGVGIEAGVITMVFPGSRPAHLSSATISVDATSLAIEKATKFLNAVH